MTLITKPDFTYVWASGGAVVAPNDAKKQLGWVAEAPPFQYDNWLQNRQDQMLAHINQRGIPQWDALTEYEAGGLSYVQGSDGKVYKSVAASGPSSVAQNPTTDVTDTYWTIAFASAQDIIQAWSPAINYIASNYVIGSNGLIYFAIQASGPSTAARNPVSEPTYWQQYASHGIIKFDTAGVTNWSVPLAMQLGIIKPKVTVVGAGGGGGAAQSSANYNAAGGGGGAGGFAQEIIDLTGITSVSVTVGDGGTAGIAGGAVAGLGGSSSFGAYCSATGGQGGNGATATSGNSQLGSGGFGGVGTGGNINGTGGAGQAGVISAFGVAGASAGQGKGGVSFYSALATLGGGATGSATVSSSQNINGGAGAPGCVVIEW